MNGVRRKKIRGIEMVYDDIGQGEPMLLIHGQPFDRTMWSDQVEMLSSQFRLIIPDLRGYGESGIPTEMVLLDELALDLNELLNELNIESAIVMGLSMGGQIAMELFKLFPQQVRGLVLADTDSRAEDAVGYERRLKLSQQIREDGLKKFTQERIHYFISNHTMQNLPEVVTRLRTMMASTSSLGSSLVQRGRAERKDLTPYLSGIEVPVLIVVGEEDEFTPVATAKFMHEKIRGAELAIIKKAGHIPNMEQPDAFNDVLKRFLETHFSL